MYSKIKTGILTIALVLFCGKAISHEMTPTYFEFEQSFVQDVLRTNVLIFNKRSDVDYYEIGVFDSEWNRVPFATNEKIVKIEYLKRKSIEIYIRESDIKRAIYICSLSKLKKESISSTSISSRICSKAK